jgi:hypothetical protein
MINAYDRRNGFGSGWYKKADTFFCTFFVFSFMENEHDNQ